MDEVIRMNEVKRSNVGEENVIEETIKEKRNAFAIVSKRNHLAQK